MAILGYDATASFTFDTTNFVGSKFTATEYGTITKITAKLNAVSGTVNARCAVYTNGGTGGTPYMVFQAQSSEVTGIGTTPARYDFTTTFNISAGTTYWLFIWADADFTFYYDNGGTEQTYNAGGTYPTWNNPETSSAVSDFVLEIFATYTPRVADNSVYGKIQRLSKIQRLKKINI